MAPRAQDSTHSVVAPVAGLLRRLIAASGSLVEAAAGSVSLVDGSRDRYAKLAERGTSCRLGSSFSLDEGVTGQVVARRRPVVLATYGQVHAGHLAAGGAAHSGAVLAVPLWWRGDVVGANVVFACRPRRFTLAEVDELELLTQSAVPDLVRLGADDPTLTHLLHPSGQADAPSPLTRREQETLALLAGGLSNREIAGALVLAPKTVEKHVAEVLRKTGTHSRTAAVMAGLHRGWLPDR
jgi:DNA-binding CsgD family transcriptional regulator